MGIELLEGWEEFETPGMVPDARGGGKLALSCLMVLENLTLGES